MEGFNTMISHCPICGGDTESYKIFNKIPQSSAQLFSDSTLEIKYSSFTAGICRPCFHIVNTTYVSNAVENIYTDANYITKKSISTAMSTNLKDIVDFIEANLNLASNELLEIGSGSGEIANYFQNQMVVTTVDPCVDSYNNPNITHYSEFFNKDVVSKINKKFDIIIARHVIEHVINPVEFLKLCQSVLTDNGVIYIEVPNLNDIISIERLTDFFNDHIQYFSNSSLSKAGSIANLTSVNSRLFLNSAHLGMVFKNSNFDILIRLDCAKLKVTNVLAAIDNVDNFIIYGAGAHAVTFASLLSTEQKNKILSVVDKDGNKSGKFLPGTQVPISTPTNFSASLIVNTSVLYAAEVEKYLLEEQQFIGKILHL